MIAPFLIMVYIYKGINKLFTATGGKVVVDSSFNTGKKHFLMKSSKKNPTDGHALLVNCYTTSIRQLSELEMRMIQGLFPILKDPLYYE